MTIPERVDAEEGAWIQRARQGDTSAWAHLMRRHQEVVFRFAYLISGDPDDAEDVAQEAFLRAYYALDRFDPARAFRPWILSITANLAKNRMRSLRRYWAAVERFVQSTPVRSDENLEDRSQRSLESQRLRQAVQALPPKYRDAVYLRYFLELSVEEAAEALGVPGGTVKSRLHRALEKLEAILLREGIAAGDSEIVKGQER